MMLEEQSHVVQWYIQEESSLNRIQMPIFEKKASSQSVSGI